MSNEPFASPTLAPLADAVRNGDAAEIRRQLQSVAPDTPGADGSTLLMLAIAQGHTDSARALLEGGADPNRAGPDGKTPVHLAAFADDPELLRTVLAHGGKPDVRNTQTDATPLESALLGGNPTQLQILLDAGADPNQADRNGDTALHVAARTNAGAALLLLLERGANPLVNNSRGASFQSYYFKFPRNALNERALAERRAIVAWLKSHEVPLEASVQADY
ncbi:ankyrin repeat domain-containing protein [Lysobacter capsici]|uniref:ankyrin repeat domain-containing protein n=1 Tax=Lysobacter capsici TaxID=435897 RepID=UPI001C007D25|nr:ankyrin repeat domain-containing protein [Lysobacter capsici]QWF19049.1 ankyrin repeat domain-containing protein [Lysobacter capsici]